MIDDTEEKILPTILTLEGIKKAAKELFNKKEEKAFIIQFDYSTRWIVPEECLTSLMDIMKKVHKVTNGYNAEEFVIGPVFNDVKVSALPNDYVIKQQIANMLGVTIGELLKCSP